MMAATHAGGEHAHRAARAKHVGDRHESGRRVVDVLEHAVAEDQVGSRLASDPGQVGHISLDRDQRHALLGGTALRRGE